jgi:hypothetical protein
MCVNQNWIHKINHIDVFYVLNNVHISVESQSTIIVKKQETVISTGS